MKEDFSKYNGEGTPLRKAQLRLLEMMVEFDRICKKYNIPYFISGGTCLGAVRHGGFIPWDDDADIDVMKKDYKKLIKILQQELPERYFVQTPNTDKQFYRLFMKIVDKDSLVIYPGENKIRSRLEYKGLSLDIFPIEKIFSYRVKKTIDFFYASAFVIKRTGIGNNFKRIVAYAIWPVMKVIVFGAKTISFISNKEKICHSYGTNIIPKIKYSNIFTPKEIIFEGYSLSGPAKPHEYLQDLYGDYMTIPPENKREVHAEKIEVF